MSYYSVTYYPRGPVLATGYHKINNLTYEFQMSGVPIIFWTNFRSTANTWRDGKHFDQKSLLFASKV